MSQKAKAGVPDSAAIREVWAWKDAIYAEVSHLPLDEALRVIGAKAREAVKEYESFRAARVRGGARPR